MPVGKRDPYYNDPERRNEYLDMVEEMVKKSKPSVWVCVCGNESTANNPYTGFDGDGWAGVIVCSVCRRNMTRKEVSDD